MKPVLVLLGLLALNVSVRAFAADDHHENDHVKAIAAEMRKQEGHVNVKNKTIGELASAIVSETKAAGKDVVDFVADAVSHEGKKSQRSGRSMDTESEIDVSALLREIASLTGADRQSRSEENNEVGADGSEDAAERSKDRNKQGGGFGGAIIPKPVLVPIPGPPGPPGPPGLPGLPGIPGKSPNLRGLKAILLARLAKILLLIKALAVACIAYNAALLATTLGLALPLYKKFKKAGVVVPIGEEQQSYGAPQPSYGAPQQSYAGYEQPAPLYGQPAPSGPYNRRSDSNAGSFAPVSESFIQPIQNQAVSGIEKNKAKFESPAKKQRFRS